MKNETKNIKISRTELRCPVETVVGLPSLLNQVFNADGVESLKNIPADSINCILTDPPYKYLKGQKLERDFDEQIFFGECRRVLKDDGFIILFGRGTSFYRWNTILAELGFVFKEEFVWDKGYTTSPLMAISRVHETVSIHTKLSGTLNKVKIPYLEMKKHNIESIVTDIKRLRTVFKNTKSLDAVINFLENNEVDTSPHKRKMPTTVSSQIDTADRATAVMQAMQEGMNEKSIIRTDRFDCDTFTKFGINSDKRMSGDRCVNVMQSVIAGMNEKTIIEETGERYQAIHPTQKPIKLIQRLLRLTTKENDIVLDTFAGSMSTAVACLGLQRKFICYEIDEEYFLRGAARLDRLTEQQNIF